MSGIVGGTAQNLNVRNNVYDDDPGILAWVPMTQPLVKTDELTVITSPTQTYNFIQSEEAGLYKYYGFLSSVGWQFKRKTLASGVWMIASGSGDYDIAWADKANKSYGYI